MSKKHKSNGSKIASGVVSHSMYDHKTKKIIFISGAMVTFVLAAFMVWFFMYRSETATVKKPVAITDPAYLEAKKQAQDHFAKIDAESLSKAQANLDQAKSSEDRAEAYIAMANASSTLDHQKALDYTLLAVKESPSARTYRVAMDFADIAGDKKTYNEMAGKIKKLGVANDVQPR